MEGQQVESPEAFTRDHRNLMYAADALQGGETLIDADAAKAEYGVPDIANDPLIAQMGTGSKEDRRAAADAFVKKYDLDTLPARVLEHGSKFGDEDREGRLAREVGVAKVMIDLALADARGTKGPSYEDRIRAVTGEDPIIIDPNSPEIEEMREQLMEFVSAAGFPVGNGKTREQRMEEWEHSMKPVNTEDFEAFQVLLKELGNDYSQLLRTEVLAKIDPALAEIALDGMEYAGKRGIPYDAFFAYLGGGKGRYDWNMDRPASIEDVRYITAHETTHFVQAVVQDWLRQKGLLGSEAAITSLSSAQAVQTEGLAQVAPLLVSGGTMEGVRMRYGNNYAAIVAQDRLQDYVRQFVGQQVAVMGRDVRDVAPVISRDFLQNPHIVEKYVRAATDGSGKRKKKSFWAEIPAGQMYGPSYQVGNNGFQEAINTYGVDAVARVAFFTEGFVDLPAMQAKLARGAQARQQA